MSAMRARITGAALALGTLLFAEACPGNVVVTPVVGDPLLRNQFGVTTDGVHLYSIVYAGYGDAIGNGYVTSTPLHGGTPTVLYDSWGISPYQLPRSITHQGSNLYWVDSESGIGTHTEVLGAPKSGAGPVTSIIGQSGPIWDASGITADGTHLYVTDMVRGRTFRMNLDGSGLTQLGGDRYGGFFDNEHHNSVVEHDGVLYVLDSGKAGVIAPQIVTIPVTGGSYTPLFVGAPFVNPHGIAIGDDTLFISDPIADVIWSMPITGGTPTVYASDPRFQHVMGLTFYDGALYGADAGDALAGTIWRITVPEPSTLALLGSGSGCAVAFAMLQRRRRAGS